MADLVSELERFRMVDVSIAQRLDTLLSERNSLLHDENSLLTEVISKSVSGIKDSERTSCALMNKIGSSNVLATAISGKVRELDCAQSRLRLALEQIDLVLDLKIAIETSRESLNDGDFEKAAKIVNRMLRHYRKKKEAESDIDGCTFEDDDEVSFRVLIDFESQLRDAILEQYNKSTDDEQIVRYCRLLSYVGLGYSGLDNCCSLIARQMDAAVQKLASSPILLENVSAIFDLITDCVRDYERQLQQDFGLGSHACLIHKMQLLSDRHVIARIEEFLEHHHLAQLAATVSTSSWKSDSESSNDSAVLDRTLEDIASLARECELFDLDLRSAYAHAFETFRENSVDMFKAVAEIRPDWISLSPESDLNKVVQEVLNHYITLEHSYMIRNVDKAIQLADTMVEVSLSTLSVTKASDFVDDVFYILKTSGVRAFSTQSLTSAIAVLNNINSFLDGEYKQTIVNRIQVTQAESDSSSSAFFTDQMEHEQAVLAELLALNNADTSTHNIILLKEFFDTEFKQSAAKGNLAAMVDACLSNIKETAESFRKVVLQGVFRHLKLIYARITPFCDRFEQCSYEFTEAEYNCVPDPYVLQLIQACTTILQKIKPNVTENVFDMMALRLAKFIADRISEICFKKTFTFSGGLQVDKDLRNLVAFFSQICSKSVRNKFLRLSQIASILQLYDISEIHDLRLENNDSKFWRLSLEDIKKMMCRRIEFNREQIEALQI